MAKDERKGALRSDLKGWRVDWDRALIEELCGWIIVVVPILPELRAGRDLDASRLRDDGVSRARP